MQGRFGVVLQRLDGPTLLQLSRGGAMMGAHTGAVLATQALSVHGIAPPPEILSLLETTSGALRNSGGALPDYIATGILILIGRLAARDGLCHGDLHPGNVITTPDGPRIVDWQGAIRAPPGLDLACSHVLLAEFAPTLADDPERPRAVDAALQSEYARLAGMPLAPPCCMGQRLGRINACPRSGSSNAGVFRPPQLEHAVQHVGGDGHLGRLAPICLRTQSIADDALPTRNVSLHQGAPVVT